MGPRPHRHRPRALPRDRRQRRGAAGRRRRQAVQRSPGRTGGRPRRHPRDRAVEPPGQHGGRQRDRDPPADSVGSSRTSGMRNCSPTRVRHTAPTDLECAPPSTARQRRRLSHCALDFAPFLPRPPLALHTSPCPRRSVHARPRVGSSPRHRCAAVDRLVPSGAGQGVVTTRPAPPWPRRGARRCGPCVRLVGRAAVRSVLPCDGGRRWRVGGTSPDVATMPHARHAAASRAPAHRAGPQGRVPRSWRVVQPVGPYFHRPPLHSGRPRPHLLRQHHHEPIDRRRLAGRHHLDQHLDLAALGTRAPRRRPDRRSHHRVS